MDLRVDFQRIDIHGRSSDFDAVLDTVRLSDGGATSTLTAKSAKTTPGDCSQRRHRRRGRAIIGALAAQQGRGDRRSSAAPAASSLSLGLV
jgi:hypothetical protein